MKDAEVAERLLGWLREHLDRPALDYEAAPRRFAWGVDATLYAFTLKGAPEGHRGPLVLRLFPRDVAPERAVREAAVQGALSALGYPAPTARGSGTIGEEPVRAFLIMDRVPGRTFMDVTMWACAAALVASLAGLPLTWAGVGILYVGVMVRWMRRLHGLPTRQLVDRLTSEGGSADALRVDARLTAMEGRIGVLGVDGLAPGLVWLRDRQPGGGVDVVCHGDFWPGNVLCNARGVTGVIDWGDAALAPREYELAWSQVAFYSGLPVSGPAWFVDRVSAFSRPLVWLVLSLYRICYQAGQPLDPTRMRYFTAFHCLRVLLYAAERRALDGLRETTPVHPWTHPRVIALVERRFLRITGVEVRCAVFQTSA